MYKIETERTVNNCANGANPPSMISVCSQHAFFLCIKWRGLIISNNLLRKDRSLLDDFLHGTNQLSQ